MSAGVGQFSAGHEIVSKPYLLDMAVGHSFMEAGDSANSTRLKKNIHEDEEAAKAAGFRAPIAAGGHTYALMANFLVQAFGDDFRRGGRLEATFIKPVFYGDTLTMHARLSGEDSGATQFEVWTENQDHERVMIGNARVSRTSR